MATPLPGELCVTHSPIKSSYWGLLSFNLRTCNQPAETKEWNPSYLCRLSLLAWINAYSVIKVFSLSIAFVERFSGLGGDLFFMVCPSSLAILGMWAFPAPAGKLASVTWLRLTHDRNSGHRPSCVTVISPSICELSLKTCWLGVQRIQGSIKKKSRHSMCKQSYLHYLLNPTQQNVLRLWMSATKHNRTHSACNRHHHHHHQVTNIFMSHQGCCRYWETSWTLITI